MVLGVFYHEVDEDTEIQHYYGAVNKRVKA